MRAYEMIAQLRKRLRDDDADGWSDDELLENINFSLSAIARKLSLWKNRFSRTTAVGVDTYSIPEDFMSPISMTYDGREIPIKGIEWALSSSSDDECVFIDNNALIIVPIPSSVVEFHLNYQANRLIKNGQDVLAISDEYVDTALYYALSLSYQKPASEESLTQSRYFLNLYKDNINDVKETAQKRRSSRTTKTNYQKV